MGPWSWVCPNNNYYYGKGKNAFFFFLDSQQYLLYSLNLGPLYALKLVIFHLPKKSLITYYIGGHVSSSSYCSLIIQKWASYPDDYLFFFSIGRFPHYPNVPETALAFTCCNSLIITMHILHRFGQ